MRKVLLLVMISLLSSSAWAAGSGIALTRGFNGVDDMNGYTLSMQYYWGDIVSFKNGWGFTGYWNNSLSYWHSRKNKNPKYENITIVDIMPVLRFRKDPTYSAGTVSPFFDLGFGIGLMNRDQFSNQQLGSLATFSQTVGAGINMGQQSQYDLSYHYVMYNNGGQFKHNDGLFINTITFAYHFS